MTAQCETCGNTYDRCMEVILDGRSHTFDCFQCAIQTLAPACAHCGSTIIGHGVESRDELYCCEHCARHSNESASTDGMRMASNVVASNRQASRPDVR
jgi:hypothetical protein